MKDDEKWPLVHEYRRVAARGLVPPIPCPECESELLPVVDSDGDPAFKCFGCRCVFRLGINVYDQMKRNLKEINE